MYIYVYMVAGKSLGELVRYDDEYLYAYVYLCMNLYIYIYIYIYIHIFICIYMYMFIYIHISQYPGDTRAIQPV
jgi:hypothetical protein